MKDALQIAIMDTGIGIAPHNQQKIFEPFVQIDSSLNRQYEGTGLGLALVKRIVEQHGGEVSVNSQLNEGSRFTITLHNVISSPVSTNTEDLPQPNLEVDEPQLETSPLILLAEDNEANIVTVLTYLKTQGYRTIIAKDGEEAINLAQSETPDLILMDISMPKINGLEATKQIRQNPSLVNVPIIALTALAMSGDHERCLEAGADDYLSKPVKLKQLAHRIQQHLASKSSEQILQNYEL
ncbi:MAG: response regulator [Cyanobacteriota bacterium]|nr:response regulator [Cyanobacteriota bacterium]